MPNKYVKVTSHTSKVDTLTLTTTGATKALTTTALGLFSNFPKSGTTNVLQFGDANVGLAFRTAIGYPNTNEPFTVGEGFKLRVGSTGTPVDFGGATFSAGPGNEVTVTGIDLTGLELATGTLFFEQVATPGTITVTLDGTAFPTSVVGSAALTAASLRTKIGANSKFSVGTGTAGIITITGAVNSDYTTDFDAGTTEFSGVFAQTNGYSLEDKIFVNADIKSYISSTGVVLAKDQHGVDIPQPSGTILTPVGYLGTPTDGSGIAKPIPPYAKA